MCKEGRRWADKVWKVQMMRYIQNIHITTHTQLCRYHTYKHNFFILEILNGDICPVIGYSDSFPPVCNFTYLYFWVQTCHQKLIEHDLKKIYILIYYNCIIHLIPNLQISIAYINTSTWKSNRNITFKIFFFRCKCATACNQ